MAANSPAVEVITDGRMRPEKEGKWREDCAVAAHVAHGARASDAPPRRASDAVLLLAVIAPAAPRR